jgi:SpoVK/Ycf46/Vps4 family AAA+-type ATPase
VSRSDFALPGFIESPTRASWDDLVLPEDCIKSLREYVLWVKHRDKVKREWQATLTGGPVALFAGPSGTGKTFASNILGSTLGLDLFRTNLRQLASKYIGETEKNLNALFDALSNEPMLLVFDEADSLFGKRSEVKDAHDRYANIESSYLLARLEQYRGPVVLTANNRDRFDTAFLRRLQFIIDFPLPDESERSRLWRLYLPARAPVDRNIDTDKLARKAALTGGQIRNAATHAAFLAAGASSSISLKHISSAIRSELAKTKSS